MEREDLVLQSSAVTPIHRPGAAGSWPAPLHWKAPLESLEQRLALMRPAGTQSDYIMKMWKAAFVAAQGGAAEQGPLHTLVFPYVPIDVEAQGLELTETSVVLDVGCLGGYGLFDFHMRRQAAGLPTPQLRGLDLDPESVAIGSELASLWAPEGRWQFDCGTCEQMPYPSGSVDLLVARTVLPYVDIYKALSEFCRVVRPGGLVLLQVHAIGYYLRRLKLGPLGPKKVFYFGRPVVAGLLFLLNERQPDNRWLRETALGSDALVDYCRRFGLEPTWLRTDIARPTALFRRSV